MVSVIFQRHANTLLTAALLLFWDLFIVMITIVLLCSVNIIFDHWKIQKFKVFQLDFTAVTVKMNRSLRTNCKHVYDIKVAVKTMVLWFKD